MQRMRVCAALGVGIAILANALVGSPYSAGAEARALEPSGAVTGVDGLLDGRSSLAYDGAVAATQCPDGCSWQTPTAPPAKTPPPGSTQAPPPGTGTPPPEETQPGPTCSSSEVWDEGAQKCYSIQSVGGKPTHCTPSGTWGDLHDFSTSTGDLSCLLPLQFFNEDTGNYQDAGLRISGAVGCLNVERGYGTNAVDLPRTLIGLKGEPFRLEVTGVIPPADLGLSFSNAGWYRPADDWSVTGRTLGEVVSGVGHTTFDLKGYLGYRYPDIRFLNVYLRFTAQPDQTEWGFAGGAPPREVVWMAAQGTAALHWFMFFVSSYPSGDAPWIRDGIGPSTSGEYLPAYMITARSAWTAELMYSWEEWTIENGEYKSKTGANERITRLFGPDGMVASYRVLDYSVWDSAHMSPGADANCDAATGYVAVPVIEAQSVLRP